MPSLFTKIIRGEVPGRFVWRDERAVGFLTIAPLRPGHTLVVPIEEIDHWLDVPPDLMQHLTLVAQKIGQAVQRTFRPEKVGLMIAGLEVRHVHLHLVPIHSLGDLDFAKADTKATPEALDAAAQKLRAALREAGHREVADKLGGSDGPRAARCDGGGDGRLERHGPRGGGVPRRRRRTRRRVRAPPGRARRDGRGAARGAAAPTRWACRWT